MASITPITTSLLPRSSTDLLATLKNELNKAQKELSSGTVADAGLAFGYRTADALRFRVDDLRLSSLQDANALARGRLEVAQTALGDVHDIGQKFASAMLAAYDSENSTLPSITTAKASLGAMFDRLNSSYNGVYVMGGTSSTTPPLTDYFSDPPSDARQAVAAAFVSNFGFAQDDPAVATITPAAMSAFLSGPFAALFDDPAWGQNWSSASSDNMLTRISPFETVETSASANHDSLRKLTASMVMIADLGLDGMGDETRRVVTGAAADASSSSLAGVARLQGEIGVRQERISTAMERLDKQVDFTRTELGNMESIDPAEASVRASDLLQKLQASYEMTSRLMQLSLLNSI
jgi:flagellar hook-associated protein 3 FlgL